MGFKMSINTTNTDTNEEVGKVCIEASYCSPVL